MIKSLQTINVVICLFLVNCAYLQKVEDIKMVTNIPNKVTLLVEDYRALSHFYILDGEEKERVVSIFRSSPRKVRDKCSERSKLSKPKQKKYSTISAPAGSGIFSFYMSNEEKETFFVYASGEAIGYTLSSSDKDWLKGVIHHYRSQKQITKK